MFLLIKWQDSYKEGPCSWPLYAQQAHDKLINYSFPLWYSIKVHSSPQFPFFEGYSFCCSAVKSCLSLCDCVDCSLPGFPVPHYLPSSLKFMSIELMIPSNHLILCHILFPSSIFPSIRIFSMSRLFTSGGQTIERSPPSEKDRTHSRENSATS